ncbi:helix-turn-helix transcriptional regulator [Staphylococcus hominis]|uniref:helix-turn-helix domain-containing protein n=1 Tax=Staphylococcus hominis TaxID=1290 RepID=UPI0007656694|nr:helix-turn-helix transcriptional regulator [Staphylococcus hominis]MDS0981252.1 helix-turn-helix transcriptional regulator [Staphylococcus hominis]CVY54148.1 phage transcriptional repressor [Staphylococcus hominis]
MTDKYDSLGEVIKYLRKFRKITQTKLSELTGFSQNTISNHENGNRKVKLNDINIYAKALGLSEYLILKINDELNNNNEFLESFHEFLRIYNFVDKAYYKEGDIYFSSYDKFEEALKIFNLLRETNVDVNNVSYEYVTDLYKQILSNDVNVSKNSTKNIENKNMRYPKVTIEELLDFNFKYSELMTKLLEDKSNIDKNALITKALQLKETSLELSEKLQYAPNYTYDAIKGEPMYVVYSHKFPKRLDEFIEQIKNSK